MLRWSYNVVQYNMILHTALQWLNGNLYQGLNSNSMTPWKTNPNFNFSIAANFTYFSWNSTIFPWSWRRSKFQRFLKSCGKLWGVYWDSAYLEENWWSYDRTLNCYWYHGHGDWTNILTTHISPWCDFYKWRSCPPQYLKWAKRKNFKMTWIIIQISKCLT